MNWYREFRVVLKATNNNEEIMWDFQEHILYIANQFINLCDFCRAD